MFSFALVILSHIENYFIIKKKIFPFSWGVSIHRYVMFSATLTTATTFLSSMGNNTYGFLFASCLLPFPRRRRPIKIGSLPGKQILFFES